MNNFLKGLLVLVIIAVIVQIIVFPKTGWLWESGQQEETESATGSSRGPQSILEVSGIVARTDQLVNKLSVTGEIVPNEFVELKSEISGKIEQLYLREGRSVSKGDLLAKINVDDLLAELEKLKYTQKLRETLENRQRQLLDREAISQEEYDQALTELQTAEADIRVIETEIRKSEIRAPFSGVVGFRDVSEGAYVTPSVILAPLYSINPAKIEFSIPGKYSTRVREGNPISFSVEGIDDPFSGSVYAIEPLVDPNTRTLALRARSANPGGVLLPGQFARVELVLETKDSVIMVPTEAVIPDAEGATVFVKKQGKVAPARIEGGIRTETELEILSGLNTGDTVLTSGILQVRPGMPVKVNVSQ